MQHSIRQNLHGHDAALRAHAYRTLLVYTTATDDQALELQAVVENMLRKLPNVNLLHINHWKPKA